MLEEYWEEDWIEEYFELEIAFDLQPIDWLLLPEIQVLGVATDHLEDNSKSSSPYSLANALSIADLEAPEY